MNFHSPYEAWKNKKSTLDPPPGFAGRVMHRIRQHDEERSSGVKPRVAPFRYAAAAAIIVSMAVGLARAVWLVVFLLVTPSKGF